MYAELYKYNVDTLVDVVYSSMFHGTEPYFMLTPFMWYLLFDIVR